MSREEIEKKVIMDYVGSSTRFTGSEDKMTGLVLDVISLASKSQSGENDDELYKTIVGCGVEKKRIEVETGDEIKVEKKAGSRQKSILDFR